MNGYQPKKLCDNCLSFNICKLARKARDGKEACKKYKAIPPPPPPKSGSNAQIPTYTPPPMPEVKPAAPTEISREVYEALYARGLLNPNTLYVIKEPCTKQRTVLSVRDFAILYDLVNHKIFREKFDAEVKERYDEEKQKQLLEENLYYQDLLRIRDKLGELNIEIKTLRVEVEE